jgi:hypothetical protein
MLFGLFLITWVYWLTIIWNGIVIFIRLKVIDPTYLIYFEIDSNGKQKKQLGPFILEN